MFNSRRLIASLASIFAINGFLIACTANTGSSEEVTDKSEQLNATTPCDGGYTIPPAQITQQCTDTYNGDVATAQQQSAACVVLCGLGTLPKAPPVPKIPTAALPVGTVLTPGAQAAVDDPTAEGAQAEVEAPAARGAEGAQAEVVEHGPAIEHTAGLPTPVSVSLCLAGCADYLAISLLNAKTSYTYCMNAANASTTFCQYPPGDCRNSTTPCGGGGRCNITTGGCYTPTPTGGGCLPSNPTTCASGFCYPASAGQKGGTCS